MNEQGYHLLQQTHHTIRLRVQAAAKIARACAVVAQIMWRQRRASDRELPTLRQQATQRLCDIFNLRITFNAAATPEYPTLYLAHHSSALDIPVLGNVLSTNFLAADKVSHWPVLGQCIRDLGTVFIDKQEPSHSFSRMRDNLRDLYSAFARGESVLAFPEGGIVQDSTKPEEFKSALLGPLCDERLKRRLGIPEHATPLVQPVGLRVTHINDQPAQRTEQVTPYVWGNFNLLRHFWRIAKCESMDIEVRAFTPMKPASYPGRRALAAKAEHKAHAFHAGYTPA